LASCALLLATTASAAADQGLVTTARSVLAKYKGALVTVRLTVKVRMVYQGKEQGSRESTSEISGTVLTPAGLTVVSNASGDPSGPVRSGRPDFQSDVTDVKLVLQDGREVAAKFVLRDRDLDLAFLQPEEPGLSLPYVAFERSVPVQPLDDLIQLSLLGKSNNREVAVSLDKVQAVLTKPRTLLAIDLVDGLRSLGCPAFDAKGQPVGLVVMKPSAEGEPPPEGLRDMLDLMQPVVIPADTVQELAAQAQAKPR
jgi:S1-C subfamily serine protease